ncbi:tyrosine-type recombinase/integrase [Tabrizicola fusiformis]|uniref:tyrosine-type recombinase/integrase n=1 Tax=Tabrizicola sp. SY72 TaxID=2741673 RepID=UPI001573A5A9|nr:integrase arm-type DNA-binding domain-containing protein [Tabrizicola sp. SY72]NTT85997.1 integrase arm-type DNA-binding domain-containing protein [Tabrizicola sp. SY72]
MPLSDAAIRRLKPREKQYKVSDFDGLFVLVRPNGSRLWQFKYRIAGKEKLLSIGPYPETSLTQARAMRDAARSMVARGIDPSEAKQKQKRQNLLQDRLTFAVQAREYLTKIRQEGRAEMTMRKLEWLLAMAIEDLGDRPIADIAAPAVLRCLRKVESRGTHETARRLRSTIGTVFRFGVASGLATNDPTYALRDALVRPKAKPRAAITEPDELGKLMRAIAGYNGQTVTKIALELLALLVPRPGELRQARWTEFDLASAVWSIPAERMKMRRPHRVPLPGRALALLKDLKALTGHTEFLLPSLVSVKRMMSENTLNTALRRLGYDAEEMTAHGCRASFSTLANESGLWNPDAIERAIAHVEANDVRRAYARGEHWEERMRMP